MAVPQSILPEPYQTAVRRELRKIPTWKLQEAYGKLTAGVPTGIELVEQNRTYALSAIEEALWERGKLSTRGSNPGAGSITLPIVAAGIGALSLALGVMALTRSSPLGQRVYYQDGRYLVKVRYGQWHDLRAFVQPSSPDVVAIYSEIGPDSWSLFDWVCQNIDYRQDIGEYWETPSETLAWGEADCEGTAILLCSLLRNFTNAYVVIGNYHGYGHAWCQNGEILETTYTRARSVPDPHDYQAFCLFNDQEVIELWPGALDEVFSLRRNGLDKLNLMAEVLNGFA